MTYAQGGLIQASDYNSLVSTGSPNFNSLWNGIYGQPALSTAAVGQTIAASEWNALFNGINNSALAQGTAITPLSPVVTGDVVTYESQLVADLAAVVANAYNSSAVGTDITATGTRSTDWGVALSIPTVTSTITVTFADAQSASNFFNRGGQVLLTASRTGGSGSLADTAWSQLCTYIGSIGLPGQNTAQTIAGASYLGMTQFGGGGSTPTIYVRNGFDQLTTAPTIYFKQFSNAGVYTADYIQILYSFSGSTLTISVVFQDTSSSQPNTITGNLSVTGIVRPPSTTYISSNWGTPGITVSAPA